MKILRNNRGVSLIEIMVGIGLLTIVAVIAVPQFQAYQRDAKFGVLRSMLTVPFRTMEVESSLGRTANNSSAGFLWARVKSKAKGEFNTPTFNASGNNWCFFIEGKQTGNYDGFDGCINQAGTVSLGGDNIPCSQDNATYGDTAAASGTITCGNTKTCTSPCVVKRALDTTSCVTGNATYDGNTATDEVDCMPGPTGEVYTKALTCNASGECS